MTVINANALSNFVSLRCLSSLLNALLQNTMAEQNIPAQPPTRTDEQIVPRSQWLTIGKSNLLFNAQKIQKNPIFQISVDILKNTNFFQALTASANVPAIYLQQFWKTMSFNDKTGVYSCQLDELWFDLSADLLRKALAITPVNPAHPFELPPSGDTCLTESLLAVTNPDTPRSSANLLWESVTQTNIDLQSDMWSSRRFLEWQFADPVDKEAIRDQSSLLFPVCEMVAEDYKENPSRRCKGVVQPATKRATPKKPTTTTPVKQSKPAPPPTKKPSKRKLPHKVRKGKPTFKLVDEDDEAQQETIPHKEGNDPDLELAKKLSLETPQEKGEGEGDDADLERAIKLSLDPAFLPQGRAHVRGVTIRDPVSEATPKLHEVVGKGKAVVTEEQVAHSLVNYYSQISSPVVF
ncbi:hypothetical protein Tco_0554602 [Tanacetum coccineum]